MEESQIRVLRITIAGLFVIYCAPFFFLAVSCVVTHGWLAPDQVLRTFIGFTQSQDQSLALLHRAILPIMGAFAPVAFRGSNADRWAVGLMLILLVTIALSLALSAVFDTSAIQGNLLANSVFPLPGTADVPTSAQTQLAQTAGMGLINSFFNRTQEALTMYLLMLFGLKATENNP